MWGMSNKEQWNMSQWVFDKFNIQFDKLSQKWNECNGKYRNQNEIARDRIKSLWSLNNQDDGMKDIRV